MSDHPEEPPKNNNPQDPTGTVLIPPIGALPSPSSEPGPVTRLLIRFLDSLIGQIGIGLPESIRSRVFLLPLTLLFVIAHVFAINLAMTDPGGALLGSILVFGVCWYGSLKGGLRWFGILLALFMVISFLVFPTLSVVLIAGVLWIAASSLGGACGASLSLADLEEDDLMFIPPVAVLAVFGLLICAWTGFRPGAVIGEYGLMLDELLMNVQLEIDTRWGVEKESLPDLSIRYILAVGLGIWCFGCWFTGRLSRQWTGRRSAGKSALILFRVQPRYIFLLILALISEISRYFVPWPVLDYMGLPVLVVLGIAFFFQGLGLILFFSILQRTVGNSGRSLMILILGLTTILLSGGWIVMLAGLIDYWFDFRKVIQIRKHLDEQKF
jgi:hypothetical protein